MKKTIFLISIGIIFLFISCEKVGRVCNVSDPMTDLPWLVELKNSDNISISKAIFKDKKRGKRIEGFIIEPNVTYPDAMTVFYNCSREWLCSDGGFVGFMCDDYEVIKSEEIYVTK